MKRLIAALLTAAMMVSIVPFSVLAEGSSTEPLPEEPAESTAAQQEEMARALESTYNPFGRTYAPAQAEESQTKQAEVDTSDVSMEATDSFGKLLLNSIDSQEGTQEGENRIIGVTVSGSTATVDYVAAEKADIVVAVYTDDTAERMTASGTIEASVTQDGEGKSTATVQLTGTIPNSFLVKAFLLDKAEHAPLSNEFTNSAYTKDIQDLEGSDISDFPEDRVVNLDDNNDTNFAVVNENVILVDATQSVGQMTISENGDGSYTITNADEKTKNLKTGDLFVYQDNDGILVLQIENIDVAGNTVTISGNEDLELIDVFDVVKIQSYDDGSQLEYDGTGVDEDVHYQGAGVVQDPLEETNTLFEDLTDGDFSATLAQKFVIGKDDFYKDEENPNDETHITSKFGINAVLNLKITAKLQYLINADKQTMSFTLNNEISGGVEAKYTEEIRIDLGVFKKEFPGVYLNYTPQFVFKGDVTGTFYYKLTQKQGYSLENRTITNISERPVQEFSIKISGTVYLGVEMAPSLKIGLYKLLKPHTEENLFKLAEIKLTATVGAEGTITSTLVLNKPEENKLTNASLGDSVHICNTCLGADFYAKITLSVGIDIIGVWKTDASIMDLREHVYTCYYSQDFKEFGEGSCPHKMYLVNISIDSAYNPVGAEVFIVNKDGTEQSIGNLTGSTGNYCYMEPGAYTLKTTVNGDKFDCSFTVKDASMDVTLEYRKGGSTGGGSTGETTSSGTCGENLTWTLDENGTLTISGTGPMKDYTYEDKERPWNKDDVKKIIIKKGVTTVGSYVFLGHHNLTQVEIPEGVVSIGDDAFSMCENLEAISFPQSLTKIGVSAFEFCEGLTKVEIPKNVTKIGASAFSWCTGLKSVQLSSGVKRIDDWTFSNCNVLEEIVIPKGITSIGERAFNGCTNLQKVSFPESLVSIESYAFQDCAKLTQVQLPDNLQSIKYWAFSGSGLTSVTIPKGMTKIDTAAFAGCDKLESVSMHENLKTIGVDAFMGCRALDNVVIPESVTAIEHEAFTGCTALKKISLPSALTELSEGLFNGCSSLSEIEIPSTVNTIGERVFRNCESLKTVTIPTGVKSIGDDAFYNSGLVSIVIPDSVTELGGGAFEDCTALKNVKLSKSIEKIKLATFTGCTGLERIEIPEGIKSFAMEVFYECANLTEIVLPKSMKEIGEASFVGCDNLKDVYYAGDESVWNDITIYSKNDNLKNATKHYGYTAVNKAVDTENSITYGTSAETDGIYTASFSGLAAGASYAVIVSTSESDPLNPENLIYINQMRADSGIYDQTFRTKRGSTLTEADMNYVVAAGGRFIEEEPDQPVDPDAPSGGGGGAGGAGAAVAGVVAVAAVVGVVLLMPVEVSGTVKLADQAALPGAAVQILKNDAVVAETATDAEGRFTMKVKRGNYTLRVRYVGADGYPVTKTMEIKAPSKNMDVAA